MYNFILTQKKLNLARLKIVSEADTSITIIIIINSSPEEEVPYFFREVISGQMIVFLTQKIINAWSSLPQKRYRQGL